MNFRNLVLIVLGLFSQANLHGQFTDCATPDVDLNAPELIRFNTMVAEAGNKTAAVRMVPVAVHVIYSNPNTEDTLTNAQLNSAFPILNSAFRGVYGGVDTEIEFCLAGVDRIENAGFAQPLLPNDEDSLKGLSFADPEEYLNVWVVEEINILAGNQVGQANGFARFPFEFAQNPNLDGVIIRNGVWGNTGTVLSSSDRNEGKTLVHEIGHWLGLFHTFQNGCDDFWTCEYSGDCCCDTPPQKKEFYRCRERKNSCKDDEPDLKDPINNYMGYSDDDCRFEFTACQSGRMKMTLDSIRTATWVAQGGDCPPWRMAGVSENEALFSASFSPNPTNGDGVLRIEVEQPGEYGISVFDSRGRESAGHSRIVWLERGIHILEMDGLGKGVNVVKVQLGVFFQTVKVMGM